MSVKLIIGKPGNALPKLTEENIKDTLKVESVGISEEQGDTVATFERGSMTDEQLQEKLAALNQYATENVPPLQGVLVENYGKGGRRRRRKTRGGRRRRQRGCSTRRRR